MSISSNGGKITLENARAAFSISEFCDAHGISRGMFYKLARQGIGPRTMRVGTRTLVSVEAAAEWRRTREAAAAGST
jgi:hypothetical protein